MYQINEDKSIYCTRGDYCIFPVTAVIDGAAYQFQAGDIVRCKIFRKNDCATVVLQRDFEVEAATDTFEISLTGDDTKIGGVISKPTDYWYEIELNPETNPQTILGYNEDGPMVFRLYPEGKDVDGDDIQVVGAKTLQELVDGALEQAKESGAFDGVSVEHEWNGTMLTVTSASGTSSANLKGEQGEQGKKGDQGEKGEKGDKGETGNSGVYVGPGDMPEDCNVQIDPDGDVFASDELVAAVIAALPVYAGEVVAV